VSFLRILEMLGVAVFAISGALAAGRKSLDLVGVVITATVTAIGGGTLRDVLLDRHPVFWIADTANLWVIFGAALGTVLYSRRWSPPERSLAVADALGLALFTISGAQIAQTAGLRGVVVVIMGTLTGVAGGVIRDVLTAEIPMIMRRGPIYATACVAGVSLYLLLEMVLPRNVAAVAGMASIAALRMAAILWQLTVPVFTLGDRRDRAG
jgi:uncharacterized membrane protein YeiH